MKTLRAHWLLVLIAIAVGVYWYASRTSGHDTPGHNSPYAARDDGWEVDQAGITGWLEVSPDGKTSVMHNTGWVVL